MKKNQTTPMVNNQPNQNPTSGDAWVFIPLSKKLILKRTDKFVLINVDGRASGIVNAKFLRKKETDEKVFLSLPPDYKIGCRVREYDAEKGSWFEVKKFDIKPTTLKYYLNKQETKKPDAVDCPDDDLPF